MGILKKYTRQELIDEALRFKEKNGKIPQMQDMMLQRVSFIYENIKENLDRGVKL